MAISVYRNTEYIGYAVSIAIVVACGSLSLNFPFVGDQVVALIAAKTLHAGGTLYIDFWDNKMPGLFWFYEAAGRLFGFNEFGVHLLELVWMTVFSLVLIWTLRTYFPYRWMAALAPLATVATYYGAADPFHLTQLEALIGLPIFLSAWFASRISWSGRRRALAFLLSCLFAGISVVFKIVYAPLFVAFWLIAALHVRAVDRASLGVICREMWIPPAIGVASVLCMVALKFWGDGALWELYWTAFEYPPLALIAAPRATYVRLAGSSLFFISLYSVWLLFIVLAIAEWWHVDRDPVTSMMLAWLVGGLALILIQRFSWWPYHFLLLFPPAGILGVRGVSVIPQLLATRITLKPELANALVLALAFPPIAALGVPVAQKVTIFLEVFVNKPGTVDDFKRTLNREYERVSQSVQFLRNETARPGPIYVFGDPLYYHLSGRSPALPIIGWAWPFFLQSQWKHLPRQLQQKAPPYIFINKENKKMMDVREGGVWDYIVSAYVPFATDARGTWYQIRPEIWRARAATARGE